ncbi:hypothetical protein OB236_14395 [Paenibacillus sp. WQ 127069]|uniref:DUF4258 domain-containing protein n=1 Tax=Paenibacillus baimaensis TaxID=2982185 RepID=A0ABT2UF88_9BACL|nr:hypothetical protein [Paenibacillus sp. WQ 127069]
MSVLKKQRHFSFFHNLCTNQEGENDKRIPLEALLSDRSLSKSREKLYQLEHQQTNYNIWYISFATTSDVGAVVVMTVTNRRE